MAYRARVEELLRTHAPHKLPELDATMNTWSGREDQLIRALEKNFNVGPGSPAPPQSTSTPRPGPSSKTNTDSLRKKLTDFYSERRPEKLSDVETIIETMGATLSEDEIMAKLEVKYPKQRQSNDERNANQQPSPSSPVVTTAAPPPPSQAAKVPSAQPVPAAPSSSSSLNPNLEARLQRFFSLYDPAKLSVIPALVARYHATEDTIMEQLEDRYGPEPSVSDDENRKKLTAIYNKYDPSRIGNVKSIMEAFAGNEAEMYRSIKKKYNISDADEAALYAAAGLTSVPPSASTHHASATGLHSKSARERLTAIYSKYEPSKLGNIDSILNTFADNEAEMFRAVRNKYGLSEEDEAKLHSDSAPPVSNPPAPSASLPTSTKPVLSDRDKLISFYTEYEPSKLERLDDILRSFAGKMQAMYDNMKKKYDVTDARCEEIFWTIPKTAKAKLVAYFIQQQPSKLKDVDQLLDAFSGKEDEMLQKLQSKYGGSVDKAYDDIFVKPRSAQVAPVAVDEVLKARLVKFFTKWNPSALEKVDEVAEAFHGRGDELFKDLVAQYGPEPTADDSSPPAAIAPVANRETLRARVERFYSHYCPENIAQVDKIIDAFESNEAVIMAALVQKYGPEPSDALFSEKTKQMMDPGPDGMRRRLTKFYSTFAPEKLNEIDKVMQVWAGREEDLFNALNDKYHVPPHQQIRLPGTTLPDDVVGAIREGSASPATGLVQSRGAVAKRVTLRQEGEPCIEGRGKLVLYISGATGLIVPRRRRYNDGVVAVVLYPTREMFRTSSAEDESAPSWTEFEGQTLLTVNAENRVVTVRIMDADQNFLGEAHLNLDEMPFIGIHEFELRKRSPEMDPFVAEALTLGFVKIRWGFMPEFTLPAGSEDAAESSGLDWRLMRLRAFFARYIPERLSEVPSIAKQFAGREIDLLDVLSLRFGPEPDPYEYRSRLERVFAHYDPPRVRESAAIAMQSGGRDDYVMKSLTKKYGPEPGAGYTVPPPSAVAPNPPNDRHRVRLTRWFMLLMPRRVVEVDYYLFRFAGREDVMFRLMAQTLGPEPTSETARENIRSRHSVTPALQAYFARRKAPPFLTWLWTGQADAQEVQATAYDPDYFRLYKRLERFYQHYNPIKVREIEETLSRWKGREDLLFEALVHKYGSEPPEVVPSRETPSSQSRQQGQALVPPTVSSGDANRSAEKPPVARTPRAVLQSFYATHNPNKLREVDDVLERFLGREEQLYHLLHMKYGVDPTLLPSNMAAKMPGLTGSSAARYAQLGGSAAAPLGSTRVLIKPPTMSGPGMTGADDAAAIASDYSQV